MTSSRLISRLSRGTSWAERGFDTAVYQVYPGVFDHSEHTCSTFSSQTGWLTVFFLLVLIFDDSSVTTHQISAVIWTRIRPCTSEVGTSTAVVVVNVALGLNTEQRSVLVKNIWIDRNSMYGLTVCFSAVTVKQRSTLALATVSCRTEYVDQERWLDGWLVDHLVGWQLVALFDEQNGLVISQCVVNRWSCSFLVNWLVWIDS